MKRKSVQFLLAAGVAALVLAIQVRSGTGITPSVPQSERLPRSLRVYVLNCGILHNSDAARYRFKKEEIATLDMSVACFLVAHPKGTLVWDTGAVPDDAWKPTGTPTTQHIVLADSQQRDVTVVKLLKGQLAELRYSPLECERVPRSQVAGAASRTRSHVR
jgi:hypothetical protein